MLSFAKGVFAQYVTPTFLRLPGIFIIASILSCNKETNTSTPLPVQKVFSTEVILKDFQTGELLQGIEVAAAIEPGLFVTMHSQPTDKDGKVSFPYKYSASQEFGNNWIKLTGSYMTNGADNFQYPLVYLEDKANPPSIFAPGNTFYWLYNFDSKNSESQRFEIPVYKPIVLNVHIKMIHSIPDELEFVKVRPIIYADSSKQGWWMPENEGGRNGIAFTISPGAMVDTTVQIRILSGIPCIIEVVGSPNSDYANSAEDIGMSRTEFTNYRFDHTATLELEY